MIRACDPGIPVTDFASLRRAVIDSGRSVSDLARESHSVTELGSVARSAPGRQPGGSGGRASSELQKIIARLLRLASSGKEGGRLALQNLEP